MYTSTPPRRAARLAALTALVAGGLQHGTAGAQTFELLDHSGAELFERFCAACRGSSGRGDGNAGAASRASACAGACITCGINLLG